MTNIKTYQVQLIEWDQRADNTIVYEGHSYDEALKEFNMSKSRVGIGDEQFEILELVSFNANEETDEDENYETVKKYVYFHKYGETRLSFDNK